MSCCYSCAQSFEHRLWSCRNSLSVFSLTLTLRDTRSPDRHRDEGIVDRSNRFLGRKVVLGIGAFRSHGRSHGAANSVTNELPPKVEIANCDIQDAPTLIKACEGCDAVIHSAALVGSWLPNSSQFITVNVQGLRNVIDAVKANPSVKKLVYTSSFFALGYTDGHIGDEDQVISQSLTKIHHYQARTLDNVEPISESLHWLS
ncbi:unnamed protein product [Sphagnum balticum]